MRKLCAVLFASATLVAATGPVAGAAGVADPATGTEWWQSPDAKELTTRLNGQRNASGKPTLPADGVVSYWAEVHSAQMAQSNTLYHSDVEFLQRATGCAGVAENVAYAPSVASAHAALVASPNHYQNLTGDWRLVGAGVATANGYKWVTQIYCTW
ncbi:MAG: CAP domain-containing protein [Acidimicrobiales bacterium]